MHSPVNFTAPILIIAALILAGCSPSEQQLAYERAEAMEESYTLETAPAIISEYRKVAGMDPSTKWAKRADARVAGLQDRVRADEHHKEIFQEHGID